MFNFFCAIYWKIQKLSEKNKLIKDNIKEQVMIM